MRALFFLSIVVLLLSGCGKDTPQGAFELAYSRDIEIPAGIPPFGTTVFPINDIGTNLDNALALNGFSREDVTSIRPKFVRLSALGQGDYNFIQRVFLEIETLNLSAIEIAFLEFVPNNPGPTLDLIPGLTEVSTYLDENFFNLILKIQPDQSPTNFITTRLDVRFEVFID